MKKLFTLILCMSACMGAFANDVAILFAFTPSAVTSIGSPAGVGNFAAQRIIEMNYVAGNSGTGHTVSLAGMVATSYDYSTNDIWTVIKDEDIAAARNQGGADVVIVLTGNTYSSGGVTTYGNSYAFGAPASGAIALVSTLNYTPVNYVVSHEFGHLMGARHANDATPGSMHGFTIFGSGGAAGDTYCFHDIMADVVYSCTTNLGIQPYWSNPNIMITIPQYGIRQPFDTPIGNWLGGATGAYAAATIATGMYYASMFHTSLWPTPGRYIAPEYHVIVSL